MKLPAAPTSYDAQNEAQTRGALEREDVRNLKKGVNIILQANQHLVIPDEATGTLYRLKVSSGVLSIVTYP